MTTPATTTIAFTRMPAQGATIRNSTLYIDSNRRPIITRSRPSQAPAPAPRATVAKPWQITDPLAAVTAALVDGPDRPNLLRTNPGYRSSSRRRRRCAGRRCRRRARSSPAARRGRLRYRQMGVAAMSLTLGQAQSLGLRPAIGPWTRGRYPHVRRSGPTSPRRRRLRSNGDWRTRWSSTCRHRSGAHHGARRPHDRLPYVHQARVPAGTADVHPWPRKVADS